MAMDLDQTSTVTRAPAADTFYQTRDNDAFMVASVTEPVTDDDWLREALLIQKNDVFVGRVGQTYFFRCHTGECIVVEVVA